MSKKKINIKFKKILNDLKRRPEDAASDLGITKKEIIEILDGKRKLKFDLIEKAVEKWPVNYNEFFSIQDDTKHGYKIFKNKASNSTERKMYRAGSPYYLYKDTVMSKVSTFRPEWIQQLKVVKNSNPDNVGVRFNNGHFLHQFTYFIGPVNFYYKIKNKKKIAKMNTGDSMYISPYIPHSFTTRENKKNILGNILALTYTDKLSTESLNEFSAIGYKLTKKFNLNLKNKFNAFKSSLLYHLNNSSISKQNLYELSGIKLKEILKNKKIPKANIINKVANILKINIRDLNPPIQEHYVKIQKYKENRSWYYPSIKKREFLFVELTNLAHLPISRAFELNILRDNENTTEFSIPTHQYLYNIGSTKIKITFDKKIKQEFDPGDSIYIKPNLIYNFRGKGKILILRIGGSVSSDALYHLSWLSQNNLKRLLNDNKSWFN
jgi:hypothetical protein